MKAGTGKYLHSLLFREIITYIAILTLVGVPSVMVYLWDIERTLEDKFSSQLELIAKQGLEKLSPIEIASIRSASWSGMPQHKKLISSLKRIELDFSIDNAVVYRRLANGRFVYIGDGNNQFKINQSVGLHQNFPKTFQAANEAWESGMPGKTRLFRSGSAKWFQVNIPIKVKGQVIALLMLNKFATPIAVEIAFRQRNILIGAALILVVGLGVRWYLTRLQLKPLLALQNAARQIAKGNLTITPPSTRDKSEIGALTRDFQKMAGDLRAGQEKIEEYHRTLEARIEERTREIRELTRSQVQHMERLETIGRLSGGIAHDFNNTLTPIIGFTEMVRAKMDKESLDAKNLERVLGAAHRARELIARILQFSRPSRQVKGPVQMGKVIREVLTLMRSTLPSSIEIIEETDGDTALVDADVTDIYTALMNLCINASHAMPEGGQLRVGLQEMELNGYQTPRGPSVTGKYVRLILSDTGTGMSEAVMARIYEPFFTTKTDGQGTGLGLPSVREIVEKHGGFIEVFSKPGEGAEFRLNFPVSEQGDEVSQSAGSSDIKGDGCVLFVEDQASDRGMGRMLLEEMGFRVTLAANSREALEIFQAGETEFDLVIAGQDSPHMAGDLLAMELKRISPDFPVILTTGISDSEDAEKIQQGVVNFLLLKPYSRETLGHAVREVLHRVG